MKYIQREITPIGTEDLFIVLDHPEADFDYATHFHAEYELNLVLNTYGKRIVGDSVEDFSGFDLVLIGPNIPHAWKGETIENNHVVTIQFHGDLLNYPILEKKMFTPIKELLQKSNRGMQFIGTPDSQLCNKILDICKLSGFNAAMEFFSLLYHLSTLPDKRILASISFDSESIMRESKSRRISLICDYINSHYMESIKLSDIAGIVSMSDSALSHFFKKRTNRSLIDYINDVRIGYASKLLFETTHSIGEIAYLCGFNNLSNFNRIFKKSKRQSPSEFRTNIRQILIKY